MRTPATHQIARAAIAQLCSTRNKHTNLLNIAKCAGWAKRDGAAMLFLPECCAFMGDDAEHTLMEADPPMVDLLRRQDDAEEKGGGTSFSQTPFRRMLAEMIAESTNSSDDNADGSSNSINGDEQEPITSIIEELRFIAHESRMWISGGGVHTSVPPSELDTTTKAPKVPSAITADESPNTTQQQHQNSKIYNTHIIIDNHGQIQSYYHKVHLFDVSIPHHKVNLCESKTTSPGRRLVVCHDTPVGNLGVSICYDMRFPEMYVDLVRMGAQVLLMPSAFTVPTGKAHWHALLKARAIENQCYVIAAAQVGKHNAKRQSYGHSVVYDPWGELIADAGGYDGTGSAGIILNNESQENIIDSPVRVPSIVLADIDMSKVASVRERMPIQQHRDSTDIVTDFKKEPE